MTPSSRVPSRPFREALAEAPLPLPPARTKFGQEAAIRHDPPAPPRELSPEVNAGLRVHEYVIAATRPGRARAAVDRQRMLAAVRLGLEARVRPEFQALASLVLALPEHPTDGDLEAVDAALYAWSGSYSRRDDPRTDAATLAGEQWWDR